MDINLTRYIPFLLQAFAIVLGGWFFLFFLLYAGGKKLSRATLDINILTGDQGFRQENRINVLYKLTIHATAVFYYLSIPVIILLFINIWAFVIIVSLSFMPLIVYVALILWTFFPASLMIRSLILRKSSRDVPGELTPGQNPGIWRLVREVAETMKTRPLDRIYLTPFNEFAVLERGSLVRKLRNQGDRILILGMGLVNRMPQNYFKSILAHEYGHFLDKDEFRIKTEEHIRYAINSLKGRFAEYRLNSPLNFVWVFLILYTRLFNRVTHGIARLREFKADRIAAGYYGSETLREALRYTVEKNITFGRRLKEALGTRCTPDPGSLHQLYDKDEAASSLDVINIRQCLAQKTDPFDSHPSISDRMKYLSYLRYPRQENLPSAPVDSFAGHRELMVKELIKSYFPLTFYDNTPGHLDAVHWFHFSSL